MANPTLIAFSEADTGTATATSQASSSLTWQTGDVIAVVGLNSGGNESWNTPTTTGSGLSFTQQQLYNSPGGGAAGAGLWTAVATAGSSGTISVGVTNADQLCNLVWQARAPSGYTIAVGVSTLSHGLTGSMTETVAITMSGPDSMVCWASSDANVVAPGGTAFTPTPTTHSSSTPGPSASPTAVNRGPGTAVYYWAVLDDETSTGSQSFGVISSGTTCLQTIVACEITLTSSTVLTLEPASDITTTGWTPSTGTTLWQVLSDNSDTTYCTATL